MNEFLEFWQIPFPQNLVVQNHLSNSVQLNASDFVNG